MLSVNIPVYNIEVVKLVKQLCLQANRLQINYEVRVYDDGSDEIIKSLNRSIAAIPHVVYVELEENLGRAAIRNKMGFESAYGYLLFIDADSLLVSEYYLENYLEQLDPKRILCGGTAYSSEKPGDISKVLRWHYGQKREAVTAEQRNRNKGFIITSNNFLMGKEVFENVHFRENLKDYGHEDTLLGYDLFQADFEIFHIENPVEHTGLESSHLFLQKTKAALRNLQLVTEDLLKGDKKFKKQVNFLNRYSKLTTFIPAWFFGWCFGKYGDRMENHLKGKKPNLRCFDFYKIAYYSTLKNR